MECIPCGKTFTGQACYDQHMVSAKHQRKVISFNHLNGKISAPPIFDDKVVAEDPKHKFNRCDVCNISFNSPGSFKTHSVSLEHVKKVLESMKGSVSPNVASFIDIPNRKIDDLKVEKSGETAILAELEPNRQHLESALYIKKIQLQSAYPATFLFEHMKGSVSSNVVSSSESLTNRKIDDLKVEKSDEDVILPELEENRKPQILPYAKCDVCDKSFSGIEPYRQHVESVLHIRKTSQLQNAPATFSCEPCKKNFTGFVPYTQHTASEVHKKKMRSLEFLKASTSQVDDSSLKMEVEADQLKTDNSNPWFCKVCNVQCSGLIPYQQHLGGTAHLKNKNKLQLQNFASPSGNCVQQDKSDISCGNKQQLISQNMEIDYILPYFEKGLNTVSTDELKESIKIFLPDEDIDFDKLRKNTRTDSGNENATN